LDDPRTEYGVATASPMELGSRSAPGVERACGA
jgi:hypothetical protein